MDLVQSSFPQITTLTVEYTSASIDELITSLSCFSSLQVLSLVDTFEHLDFGSYKPWEECNTKVKVAFRTAASKYLSVVAYKTPAGRPRMRSNDRVAIGATMIWYATADREMHTLHRGFLHLMK
ncbi:hypothetical protein BT96DRAFT_992765 [Gymnopus androsaceus JB14]|uniref:F-box domain-containing protein n=1 Tax=Gymnopus androsaceus JB14 TaxID=1447944 RepID=A0A6A4HRR1_9AGAR|nr:hypothetical protein BT96DRAFT_992765 [Gymnopus androsaceus JB14]